MFIGSGVESMHSCEQCGHPHLTEMPPVENTNDPQSAPLPRSGGGGLMNHTRDNF